MTRVEEHRVFNRLHRLDGPALLEWESVESRRAGELPILERWYKDSISHRINGPAALRWESARSRMDNEPPITEEWRVKGELHRINGPAYIGWESAKDRVAGEPPKRESWFAYGERHRVNGPAVTHHGTRVEWWLNGAWYMNQSEYTKVIFPADIVKEGLRIEQVTELLLDRIEGLWAKI